MTRIPVPRSWLDSRSLRYRWLLWSVLDPDQLEPPEPFYTTIKAAKACLANRRKLRKDKL